MNDSAEFGVTLLDLQKDRCKFPVSGYRSDLVGCYLFCAEVCASGETYCAYHRRVATDGTARAMRRH